MGDQIGQAVSGNLYYVPLNEFERIRKMRATVVDVTKIFAALCRINILYMISRAGSGHIGSSFSSIDIMSWIELNELQPQVVAGTETRDKLFFSSKGHDAPALYSTWIGSGKMAFEKIHQLRRLNGLPGHPDVATPYVVTNTGSLGMGVSKAKGMIHAKRLLRESVSVFVLTGDGELQEGQFWESLISAANHKLHELTVIIDHNKMQSDTLVSTVSDLGDIESKLKSFGWHVVRCDGNNLESFSRVMLDLKSINDKPKIIIADTIKGKGVSFMEHTSVDSDVEFYRYHSGAPSEAAYVSAIGELIESANAILASLGEKVLELETVDYLSKLNSGDCSRLVPVYSKSLLKQAEQNAKIVVLDADLILDTGLVEFQKQFPQRFIECGIAEQDMVSQAGGLALMGFLPIVHSFACFLSARPNEQIYNNSTEKTKIIYVGSLAGLLPAGPGHSHQAVRDLSALGGIPGLILVEPCCPKEVELLLDWAINENSDSTYMRLVSIPWEVGHSLPVGYIPVLGRGVSVWGEGGVTIITYGLIMVANAVSAAKILKSEFNICVSVINMPWLNKVDPEWISDVVDSVSGILVIDNHYSVGGLGDRISDAVLNSGRSIPKYRRMAVDGIPNSGGNSEVIAHHQLSIEDIVRNVREIGSSLFPVGTGGA